MADYGAPQKYTAPADGSKMLTQFDMDMIQSMHTKAMAQKDKSQFKSVANDEEFFDVQNVEADFSLPEKTYEQKMLEEFVQATLALNPEIFGNTLDINTQQFNMRLQNNVGTILKIPKTLTLSEQRKEGSTAKDRTSK